jgi:hypothetical protein
VEQPAESVAPADAPVVVSRRDGPHLGERRLLIERAVWPVRVVVGGVLAQNTDPSFGTPQLYRDVVNIGHDASPTLR